MILADGSVDFGVRYTVSFTEDPEVVKKLVQEFSNIKNIHINWKIDKLANSARARAYGKHLTDLIGTMTKVTRTRKFETHPKSKSKETGYPEIKLPSEIFKSKEIARNFLRYYATCDGGPEFSVYKRSNGFIQIAMAIKIGCENPYLRKQLKSLFEKLDIRVSEMNNGLVMSSLENFEKFKKEIQFMEESKVRRGKLFRGFTKNQIIELMIFCRKISVKREWINKNFKQTKDLEDFLKKCLIAIRDRHELRKLFSLIEIELNEIESLYPVEISVVSSVYDVPAQ